MTEEKRNVQLTPDQLKLAYESGLNLLANPEVRVPISEALGGGLAILKVLLSSLGDGSLVLANPRGPEGESDAPGE